MWHLSGQQLDNREIFQKVFDRYKEEQEAGGQSAARETAANTGKRARKAPAGMSDVTFSLDELADLL